MTRDMTEAQFQAALSRQGFKQASFAGAPVFRDQSDPNQATFTGTYRGSRLNRRATLTSIIRQRSDWRKIQEARAR